MNRGVIYEVAWEAIDEAIVRGVRAARRPVSEDAVGRVCNVSHLVARFQLRDALARLVDRGLIRRLEIERPDPRYPLLASSVEIAYEATGGAHVTA